MPVASIISENIVSPLGFTAEENFESLVSNNSGVKTIMDESILPVPFSGAKINHDRLERHFINLNTSGSFTRLEKMILISIDDAIKKSGIDVTGKDTVFIYSTTKGNIELLSSSFKNKFDPDRIHIWKTAEIISGFFQNPNKPAIISNACISGVVAILIGAGLLQNGKFRNAVVCGVDALTKFVVSGFQSFLAISETPCKPFDKNRSGISLGEACATVVLTSDPKAEVKKSIRVMGGATSNDANHISGPSRTGEGLVQAIESTFSRLGVKPGEIDFISAHGTATPYNDEMEAIALSRTGLESVPANSYKGYYGHTLGAAGVLETAATLYSMKNNILIRSLGYTEHGVSKPIQVISNNKHRQINTALKIASGFGGCNAAMILKKHE